MVADIDILPRFNNENGFIGNEMKIAMIAAMAKNRIIGADNDMPWHLPADLKHFKAITLGKAVIMGRKTYESIGRALPGRPNIVITSNADYSLSDATVVDSPESAIEVAKALSAEHSDNDEIMIIGGAEIYALALPRATRLYLTQVHAEPKGDVFFPELDLSAWELVMQKKCYVMQTHSS